MIIWKLYFWHRNFFVFSLQSHWHFFPLFIHTEKGKFFAPRINSAVNTCASCGVLKVCNRIILCGEYILLVYVLRNFENTHVTFLKPKKEAFWGSKKHLERWLSTSYLGMLADYITLSLPIVYCNKKFAEKYGWEHMTKRYSICMRLNY